MLDIRARKIPPCQKFVVRLDDIINFI